ncbi:alpha/beta-hydrolase [Apiospora aurea]|uniref:Carboxylic ester hydrolase n=1 Tax=Apiospora aurea TaxID=335848 RepID=A0ABR1PUV0_9PEZI
MKKLIFHLLTWFPLVAHAVPTVDVLNGTYEGLHLPEFRQDVFLGIPYAQDTSGPNRFRVPQSLNETWDGVRPAKQYGHACPDENVSSDSIYGMGEDCLSINIVRPAGGDDSSKLPIMLWIHGGSYQVGTTGLPTYNLTFLVQRSVEIGMPIIGASINYRKGGWGMMYSREIQGAGQTNLSLRDMRKALAWIQENVKAFGGDPENVTIWGESSGSFAVGLNLFTRSQAANLRRQAWYNGSDWYQTIYDKIVNQVNCSDVPDTLACLRTVDYDTLYPFMASSKVGGPGFYPTVDGDIIPNYPTELLHSGRFADIPHLYGTNSDEGTDNAPKGPMNTDADLRDYLEHGAGFGFPASAVGRILELYPDDPAQGIPLNTGAERFADAGGWQYKRVAAIVGDVFYHAPRLDDARHYAQHSPDTYIYRFNTRGYVGGDSNVTEGGGGEGSLAPAYKGVAHYTEVAFVFGNPAYVGPWPGYRALSEQMKDQWIRFAHHGNPNDEGLPAWPRYGDGDKGLNLVLQTQGQGGSYVEEDTYRLAGREYLTQWARRRHV